MQKFTYDFEADWIVNRLCNFSCAYCDMPNDREARGVLSLNPKDYAEFFSKYGRWMLHISGGEPLIHSKTVDVMKAVTEAGHFVSLNTNLSQMRRVYQLAYDVSPSSVEYIHVAVHPKQRRREPHLWRTLLGNIQELKRYKFEVFASIVMDTDVFGEMYEDARDRIAEVGVVTIPKLMRIPDFEVRDLRLLGKHYPEDYTKWQMAKFKEYALDAFNSRPDLASSFNTVNPMLDVEFVKGFPDFRVMGVTCEAGSKFFKIDEVGVIWRCERKEEYGNIAAGEFNPVAPHRCNESFCPYYCLKYSDWKNHLVQLKGAN